MDCSMPGLPSLTISPSFPQIHVSNANMPSVMPSRYLTLWCPLFLLASIFPSIKDFSNDFHLIQLFASGDQNTGASDSASVLPMKIQGWFSFRLTDFISLLSKGLSGVFSSTTVWRHQFFGALPSLQSNSHNHMRPLGRPRPSLYRPFYRVMSLLFNTLV